MLRSSPAVSSWPKHGLRPSRLPGNGRDLLNSVSVSANGKRKVGQELLQDCAKWKEAGHRVVRPARGSVHGNDQHGVLEEGMGESPQRTKRVQVGVVKPVRSFCSTSARAIDAPLEKHWQRSEQTVRLQR